MMIRCRIGVEARSKQEIRNAGYGFVLRRRRNFAEFPRIWQGADIRLCVNAVKKKTQDGW